MYVGEFEGTMTSGEFEVTFEDLFTADESLKAKKAALPCQSGWSLIQWYSKLGVTDMEVLVIAWGGVCKDDQSSQWEGFPAMTSERKAELAYSHFLDLREDIEENR